MLDSDLASIYGVETKALNRAVRRNRDRFPKDFVFQVTQDESELLRRQIGTLKSGRGQHRKYLPWVFTEHGAIMAANVGHSRGPRSCQLPSQPLRLPAPLPLGRVLNSRRAVQMNTTCGDAVGWTALPVWETGERSGERESTCLSSELVAISCAKLRAPISSAIFLSDESVHESEGENEKGFFRPDILCRERSGS